MTTKPGSYFDAVAQESAHFEGYSAGPRLSLADFPPLDMNDPVHLAAMKEQIRVPKSMWRLLTDPARLVSFMAERWTVENLGGDPDFDSRDHLYDGDPAIVTALPELYEWTRVARAALDYLMRHGYPLTASFMEAASHVREVNAVWCRR